MIFIKKIEECNPNKKLIRVNNELFIRGRKLNISIVFITQYYFTVPKFYTLFYYEYFKQTGTSINCI